MPAGRGIFSLPLLQAAVLLLLALLAAAPVAAAPLKARTQSGSGILLIGREHLQLTLYREPSLGRIATLAVTALPLSPSIKPPAGFAAAVVTAKKLDWYRIIYDESEREGWIKGGASYRYLRWQELLADRPVIMLGGLRKEYYQLRRTTGFSAEPLEPVNQGVAIKGVRIEADWLEAVSASTARGWLRWRDDNNRLVISIQL